VHIDPKTGETEITRVVTVVPDDVAEGEEAINEYAQRRITDALKTDKDAVLGKTYTETLPPFEFGRVQTQMARQVVTGRSARPSANGSSRSSRIVSAKSSTASPSASNTAM